MADAQALAMRELPPLDPFSTISFEELMRLERLDDNTFRSLTRPFVPGSKHLGFARAYGGHVYAQSAWAAAHTVSDFVLHNIAGYFLKGGKPDIPFVYRVQRLRDGRHYCLRRVDVTQGSLGLCFTCVCSFKLSEPHQLEFQTPVDLWKEFAVVLDGKNIEDHPEHPSIDTRSFMELPPSEQGPPDCPRFSGLQTLRVDMKAYNASRAPQARRQLNFYKTLGALSSGPQTANLHAAVHLYACDRNSLAMIDRHLDVDDHCETQTSLSYNVTMHGGGTAGFNTLDEDGKPRWFLQETWTDRLSDGRGLHHSKIYDLQGTHIATTVQDGLLRLKFDTPEQQREAYESLKVKARTKL